MPVAENVAGKSRRQEVGGWLIRPPRNAPLARIIGPHSPLLPNTTTTTPLTPKGLPTHPLERANISIVCPLYHLLRAPPQPATIQSERRTASSKMSSPTLQSDARSDFTVAPPAVLVHILAGSLAQVGNRKSCTLTRAPAVKQRAIPSLSEAAPPTRGSSQVDQSIRRPLFHRFSFPCKKKTRLDRPVRIRR